MHSSKTFFLSMLLASFIGGAAALGLSRYFQDEPPTQSIESMQNMVLSRYASENKANNPASEKHIIPDGLNFLDAAERVTPAVVHIKTRYDGRSDISSNSLEDMFNDLWGDRGGFEGGHKMSSGSGVVVSMDGYIVTNNHVIEGARVIEVVLDDKRSYKARVIGTDPTTDLALLKIPETNLDFIPYGDSDDVKVGQWVLAVGNPFDLTSTVTAGIVSAKARNINILRSRSSNYAIESFIQTDAAVNPGNSGGALVDLEGNLIGVNTAIATNTGSYAGYSFAVPVTLVKKVMDDLLNYGEVQRALMGVSIQDVSAELALRHGFEEVEGVYIAGVGQGSGAEEAGIQEGDIIVSIEGNRIKNTSALQELVARNRPGDKINVTYKRGGKSYDVHVTLKNIENTTDIVRTVTFGATEVEGLGIEIRELQESEMEKLELKGGLKVVKIREGVLREARIDEGFIITHIGQNELQTVEEFMERVEGLSGNVLIEGVYPNGQKVSYGVDF